MRTSTGWAAVTAALTLTHVAAVPMVAAPPAPDAAITPFLLRDTSDVIVPVTVNGHGPFRFVLDTGAARSALAATLAQRLRVSPTNQTRVVTPSGTARQPLVRISTLGLGGATVADLDVMVLPSLTAGGEVDGLVGQDILGALAFTLDYRRRQIAWHSDDHPAELTGVRLPLHYESGVPVVTLAQRSTRRPLRLVPDSGADSLVLFEAEPGRRLGLTPLDTIGWRTLTGRRLVRRALVDTLDVGDLRLRARVAILADDADAEGRLADGLLPLHAFREVTLNARQGFAMVRGLRE